MTVAGKLPALHGSHTVTP